MHKPFTFKYKITIFFIFVFPFIGQAQTIDLKLTAHRFQTPYVSSFTTGAGAGVDIESFKKSTINLRFGIVSKSRPLIMINETGLFNSGLNIIEDKTKWLDVRFLFSVLGSRDSKLSTKLGAGFSYQKNNTDYFANATSVNGEITSLDERTFDNSSNRMLFSIEEQLNITKKINISFGISYYLLLSSEYPRIMSMHSSTFQNSSTFGMFDSRNAPYNDIIYSFSIGYSLYSKE